jgi:hypothetical protein
MKKKVSRGHSRIRIREAGCVNESRSFQSVFVKDRREMCLIYLAMIDGKQSRTTREIQRFNVTRAIPATVLVGSMSLQGSPLISGRTKEMELKKGDEAEYGPEDREGVLYEA